MFGDYNTVSQRCDCYGVMARNNVNGTCTAHICGSRGYPVSGRWCTCYVGSRLVNTDPVCQCQKPCSIYGVYQPATDACLCQVGFSGDLCEQRLITRLPVPRDLTIFLNYLFTFFLSMVCLINLWTPHIRMQHRFVHKGAPNAVRDTIMRPDGTLIT